MKEQIFEKRTCPKCGCTYTERPALSRNDNNTLICPDCGTREALETMGISIEEQGVIDISPGNLGSSLCFLQPSISHGVLCM